MRMKAVLPGKLLRGFWISTGMVALFGLVADPDQVQDFISARSAFLPAEVRVELMLAEIKDMGLDNVAVETFTGATVDFARKHEHPLQCTLEKE